MIVRLRKKVGLPLSRKENNTMKTYICRLRNHNGFIIDGATVEATDKNEALNKYFIVHPYAKTDKCKYDYYTVEEYTA